MVLGVHLLRSLAKLGRIESVLGPFWVTLGSPRAQSHLGSVVLGVFLFLRLAKLARIGSVMCPFWVTFGVTMGTKPSRVIRFRCPSKLGQVGSYWVCIPSILGHLGVISGPKPPRVSSFSCPLASPLGQIESYWVQVGPILGSLWHQLGPKTI